MGWRSLLPLLLIAPAVLAEWGMPALMAELASADHPARSYLERRHSAFLDQPLESHGTLVLTADGTLVKAETGSGRRLIVSKQQLTIERSGQPPRTVDLAEQPELAAMVAGLRALLAGDLATLERHFRPALSGDREAWSLTLIPHHDGALQRLLAVGHGGELARIRVEEHDGDSSELLLGARP